MLPLAAWISHHYLYAWGELSSSGCVFHPGERPTRNRSPANRLTAITLSGRSSGRPTAVRRRLQI